MVIALNTRQILVNTFFYFFLLFNIYIIILLTTIIIQFTTCPMLKLQAISAR